MSEVNKSVEELIGLSYSQFTQISMLAQGEFQKLLNADTKDRIEIFRKIFNTQNYQTFQLKLKERFIALEREYGEQKRSVSQYIESIVYSDNDEVNEHLNEIKSSGVYMIDEICDILIAMNDTDNVNQNKRRMMLADLDKRVAQLTVDINTAQKAENARTELTAALTQLDSLTKSSVELKKLLNDELSKQPVLEELLAKSGIIRNEMSEYDKLTSLLREGRGVASKIKALTETAQNNKIKFNEISESLDKFKAELVLYEGTDAALTDLRHTLNNEDGRYELLKQFEQDLTELGNLETASNKAKKEYLAVKNDYDTASVRYRELENLFFDTQAGVLSARLADGVPCPVCGSLAHPCPAELPENAPTEEQLKIEKRDLEFKLNNLQHASVSAEKAAFALKSFCSDVSARGKQLMGETDDYNVELVKVLTASTKRRGELMSAIMTLEARLKRRDKLNNTIPQLERQVEQLRADDALISSEISALNERRNQLLSQYNQTVTRLQYKSKDEAIKALSELDIKVNEIKSNREHAENEYKLCTENIHRAEAHIASLNSVISSAGEYNLDKLNAEIIETDKSRVLVRKELEEIAVRLSANTEVLNAIIRKSGQISDLTNRIKNISAISNTANGTVSKKDKLLFETYIQMTWFDRVIVMANLRFSQMTGGQYRLVRRTTAENRVSQSGLDLNVIDYKNGTTRSVKTLSGGESFKASLSLALGLSDVVQSISGGIHLDAMFIDEGFGSLDDESLAQAIEVLRGLSDTNRTVGIISHVSELKQCIDNKLIITKDNRGVSKVKLDV